MTGHQDNSAAIAETLVEMRTLADQAADVFERLAAVTCRLAQLHGSPIARPSAPVVATLATEPVVAHPACERVRQRSRAWEYF